MKRTALSKFAEFVARTPGDPTWRETARKMWAEAVAMGPDWEERAKDCTPEDFAMIVDARARHEVISKWLKGAKLPGTGTRAQIRLDDRDDGHAPR